jgi:hypothetical protein
MSAYTDGTGFAKGIIWVEGNQVDVLREPLYVQATGLGDTVVVEWHGNKPPPPEPSDSGVSWRSIATVIAEIEGWVGKQVHAFSKSLDQESADINKQMAQTPKGFAGAMMQQSLSEEAAGVDMWLGIRSAYRFAERELAAHPVAANVLATTLDALGVIGGIAAIIVLWPAVVGGSGLAFAGAVAGLVSAVTTGAASGALFFADVGDSYLRIKGDLAALRGDQSGALISAMQTSDWEASDMYRNIELIGTVLTLPDSTRGLMSAGSDLAKAGEKMAQADEHFAAVQNRVNNMLALNAQKESDLAKNPSAKYQLAQQKISSKRWQEGAKKALETARDQQSDAHRELKLAIQHDLFKPDFSRTKDVLGHAALPELPASLTVAGLGVSSVSTPLFWKSAFGGGESNLSSPFSSNAALKLIPPASGGTQEKQNHYLSFRMFTSTRFGQAQ